MLNQQNYRHFLKEELNKRMGQNSRYSGRAFARDLNLSPGELSEILKGKRALTIKKALKISQRLGLNEEETKEFLELIAEEMTGAQSDSHRPHDKHVLQIDLFNIVSDWYCFAILNLAECEGFQWNYQWIATKLGINPFQVELAIERMTRVGLIQDGLNGLSASEDFVFSPDGIPSQAIKNYHHQILDKAKEALVTQSVDEREFSGLGLALDPKYLPQIKKDMARFRNEIVEKYNKGKKTKVYQLEFSLFQLTQGETHE
ncbi:MAG: TIGR02147 family protein [Bacteriovoracaceae bacterium]|nr:TIGR02147 family protein [Bacteriovoracaceae bacterium]